MLIDGKRLVQELVQVMTVEGIALQEILRRESDWHDRSLNGRDPARILGGFDAGVPLSRPPAGTPLEVEVERPTADG